MSKEAIDYAREHYSHPALHFECGNAEEFQFNRQFDMAVCFELIEHVNAQERAIANIKKHLKKDGLLVISTPRPLGNGNRSAFHTHELPYADFKAILCIASARPLTSITGSVVVNGEQYIKILERDVAILHRVEDELRARLDKTTPEREKLSFTQEQLLVTQREILRLRDGELQLQAELRDSRARNHDYLSQLTTITSSRGWRILNKGRQVRDWLLLVGSQRRRAARLAFKVARKLRQPTESCGQLDLMFVTSITSYCGVC